MGSTVDSRILAELKVFKDGPSVLVAYLLWFFLGILSAHRFYLGRPGTAFLQIAGFFIVIGLFWLLNDLFLIPGMVRAKQDEIRRQALAGYTAGA